MLGLPGMLLAGSGCRAQGSMDVWAAWAASPFEILGPEDAHGVLLYLHAEGLEDQPVALIFAEMARVAQWDVLRINRRSSVDIEANDDALLEFLSSQIDRVRRNGYSRVIVGGVSRGGWLALSAATLPALDAAIGVAPRAVGSGPEGLERTGHTLARLLADAKARRTAAFFLSEDLDEDAARQAAVAVRQALASSGSRFMVVDRPPDLHGRSGASSGRFARRYRDCLLEFIQARDGGGGEVPCSPSTGYAVGAEIGFPALDPAPQEMPANADPAFKPFWGRWEGDAEDGTYMILETVDVLVESIFLRIGISDGPGRGRRFPRLSRDLPFQLDGSRTRIYHKRFEAHPDMFVVKLKSDSELEYMSQRSAHGGLRRFSIRLHKRTMVGSAR